MNSGLAIYGLAKLENAWDDTRRAQDKTSNALSDLEDAKFVARSHVHGLRALVDAHKQVEDELIAALKAENADHPLASREAVDAAAEEKRARLIFDPKVIQRTYPDGKLPKNAVGGTPPSVHLVNDL